MFSFLVHFSQHCTIFMSCLSIGHLSQQKHYYYVPHSTKIDPTHLNYSSLLSGTMFDWDHESVWVKMHLEADKVLFSMTYIVTLKCMVYWRVLFSKHLYVCKRWCGTTPPIFYVLLCVFLWLCVCLRLFVFDIKMIWILFT